jgi:hypothetical protein
MTLTYPSFVNNTDAPAILKLRVAIAPINRIFDHCIPIGALQSKNAGDAGVLLEALAFLRPYGAVLS